MQTVTATTRQFAYRAGTFVTEASSLQIGVGQPMPQVIDLTNPLTGRTVRFLKYSRVFDREGELTQWVYRAVPAPGAIALPLRLTIYND